jgi:hypothetical protein
MCITVISSLNFSLICQKRIFPLCLPVPKPPCCFKGRKLMMMICRWCCEASWLMMMHWVNWCFFSEPKLVRLLYQAWNWTFGCETHMSWCQTAICPVTLITWVVNPEKLVRLSQQPYHLAQRKLPNWWRPGRQSIFDPPGFVICREKSYCWKCNLYYCYIFLYFFCQVPTRNCMCIFYSYSSLSCWCLSICHCLRETSSVLLLTSWPQGP